MNLNICQKLFDFMKFLIEMLMSFNIVDEDTRHEESPKKNIIGSLAITVEKYQIIFSTFGEPIGMGVYNRAAVFAHRSWNSTSLSCNQSID